MRIKGLKKYSILLLISVITSPVLAETPVAATPSAEPTPSPSAASSTEASLATPASEASKTETKPEAEQPPVPKREGTIARSLFTSAVRDREPIDQLEVLSSLISEAFYFTEFRDYQGRVLSHQWLHHGKVMHTVPFTIAGKRWRVHSSKKFMSGARLEGSWYVRVIDEDGKVIHEDRIYYIRPSSRAELDDNREKEEEVIDATTSDKATDTTSKSVSEVPESSSNNTTNDKPVADEVQESDKKVDPTKGSTETDRSTSYTPSAEKPESKPEKEADSTQAKEESGDEPKVAEDKVSADKPNVSKEKEVADKSSDTPKTDVASDAAEKAPDSTKPDTKLDDKSDNPNASLEKVDEKPIWDRL